LNLKITHHTLKLAGSAIHMNMQRLTRAASRQWSDYSAKRQCFSTMHSIAPMTRCLWAPATTSARPAC